MNGHVGNSSNVAKMESFHGDVTVADEVTLIIIMWSIVFLNLDCAWRASHLICLNFSIGQLSGFR